MTVSLEEFSGGMRKLAASVTVITTRYNGVDYGLTASAVTSLSADPPSLLACIHREGSAFDPIERAGKFCVNILSRKQTDVSTAFAQNEPEDRFKSGAWSRSPGGMPYLMGAAASFECKVMDVLPGFSHGVFVGLITDITVSEAHALLYADGEYGHFNLRPR
ncbi:flavin reductase family protein [Robiginitomaculum antarcticum]|uniref:flavin reductase family protein n=1 Tax=Robiginitomaculum antarcticum TaxID=437507 RepID=UPI000362350E|nr:flavin reductase family protein [Robiginitomaculum antarcticum]